MTYAETTKELIDAGITSLAEVYDYETSRLRDTFNDYFIFCRDNLTKNENALNINPARFFYSNVYSVNGKAGKGNGYSVIKIHYGTIDILQEFFDNKGEVFLQEQFSLFAELEPQLDAPLTVILFHVATLFTFYHERAHLIQKSADQEFSFQESYELNNDNEEFSLQHHIYEMDADLEGTHFCVMHLLGYWDSLDEADQTRDNLHQIIVLGVSSIMVYFIYLMGQEYAIYYRERLHPHLIVRISYIVDLMVKTVNANMEAGINLSDKLIIRDSIVLSEQMFLLEGENRVRDFAEIFLRESKNIEDYVNFLLGEANNYQNLAHIK